MISSSGSKTITQLFNDIIVAIQHQQSIGKKIVSEEIEELKKLSRSKAINFDDVNKNYADILVKLSEVGQVEAQKCISNLILNYDVVRNNFISPYTCCVASRLNRHISSRVISDEEVNNYDILYFDVRIINLLAGLCPTSRAYIHNSLTDILWDILALEADRYSSLNHSLILETLKAIFNLTLEKSSQAKNPETIKQSINRLFSIVIDTKDFQDDSQSGTTSEISTDSLIVNLIHLMTNMTEDIYSQLKLEFGVSILNYLDSKLVHDMNLQDIRSLVLPVLNVCSIASRYNKMIREEYYQRIFASTTDFHKRPEEYDSLRGRLVKLMTHVDIVTKEVTSEFLFNVCDKNVEKLIAYTGFGNSVAFLAGHGLLSREHKNSFESKTNQLDVESMLSKINPITGRYETNRVDPIEKMSEKEKEDSAIELANAITKLSNLGIVKPARIDISGRITDIHPDP